MELYFSAFQPGKNESRASPVFILQIKSILKHKKEICIKHRHGHRTRDVSFPVTWRHTKGSTWARLIIFDVIVTFYNYIAAGDRIAWTLPLKNLKKIMENYEKLWKFLKNYEKLWKIMKFLINYGKLWKIMKNYERLWKLWKIMKNYEKLWKIMKIFEKLWKFLKNYEKCSVRVELGHNIYSDHRIVTITTSLDENIYRNERRSDIMWNSNKIKNY